MKGISALSYWIDETMPERAAKILAREKIDADEFQRRIGPLLGEYRGGEHVKSNTPQRGDEAEFVRRLSGLLAEAAQQFAPSAMPLRTHALLGELLCLRLDENWYDLQKRILRDLQTVQAVLPIVGSRLRAQSARRGRKTKQGRDELLAHVIDEITRQLGPSKKRARIVAFQFLQACGIGAPSPDQKEAAKAASRAAKKPHRN